MKNEMKIKRPYVYNMFVSGLVTIVLTLGASSVIAADSKPLSADFIMTRTLSALSDSIKSTGKLYLGSAGMLRWEMISPARSVLIVNGDIAWIHYPDMGVTKGFELSTDPVMGVLSEHLLALTAGEFSKLDGYYSIRDGLDKKTKILQPKQQNIKKVFKELRVVASAEGVVSAVELVSQNGDITKIEFKNVSVGVIHNSSLFEKPESN